LEKGGKGGFQERAIFQKGFNKIMLTMMLPPASVKRSQNVKSAVNSIDGPAAQWQMESNGDKCCKIV
jgi:hypothetical protein